MQLYVEEVLERGILHMDGNIDVGNQRISARTVGINHRRGQLSFSGEGIDRERTAADDVPAVKIE